MTRRIQSLDIVLIILLFFGSIVSHPAEAQNDAIKAKAIQKYLADNFGMPGYKTSWYDSINGIMVQRGTQ